MKWKFVSFPEYINEVSTILGRFRTKLNADLAKKKPECDRGRQNDEVNILGIKAELIARHVAFDLGGTYHATRLIADTPLCEPDIVKSGNRYDVKGVKYGANMLTVNDKAHLKNKGGITHYFFIQIMGETKARYTIFEKGMVDGWELKQLPFTPAYCKQIER